MRTRRLLLATVALSTGLTSCKKDRPIKYANEKSPRYSPQQVDAGVDAPADSGTVEPPPAEPK